jgi:hypothetical protein
VSGAGIDASDLYGVRPLQLAAACGSEEVVRLLTA